MPKNVLYFAENAISPIQGGGIVVHAMLKDLPPDNLLGVYVYRNITPAPAFASRLHALPQMLRSEEATRENLLPQSPVRGLGDEGKALGVARAAAGPILDSLAGGFERHVADLVARDGFRPDVVFTAPLSLRMLRLAVSAARRYAVPMVMLNMDDWMAEERARFGPLQWLWDRLIKKTMLDAKHHVIYAYSNSDKLARVLTQRYGIPHETMNNASNDLLPPGVSWTPAPARNGTVITFAGAMNWNLQGQTLLRVAEAVAELRADREVELRIYAPWEFAPLANLIQVPGAVTYCGFRASRDLADAYLDSDFLVLTTTFRNQKIHLFRHSLATKLSDYLCAGRPVLSFGHPDWAVHDYVEQNGCGIAGRRSERTEMKNQIIRALELADEERQRIGENNRRLWARAHDARVMARRLREILGIDDGVAPAAARPALVAESR